MNVFFFAQKKKKPALQMELKLTASKARGWSAVKERKKVT